jgi:hypothetical protein
VTDLEAHRRTAHAILDAVSAFDAGATDNENHDAMGLAAVRLQETGAVTVAFEGTVRVTIDATPLAEAALLLTMALVRRLAQTTGKADEVVVAEVRELLDDLIA